MDLTDLTLSRAGSLPQGIKAEQTTRKRHEAIVGASLLAMMADQSVWI
ncbi:hypothetical protein HNO91_25740 [Pseudomonas corrugata]|uniref:Uncharacterized protein n=1 Tax=Pseudomonas corrugata TaxID=47879 RepID=A0A7Y5ZCD8_9PSED|nr:hypothetical protein [Pseudomonas corrugata]NUT89841.1 hypothetical protein [Pseudomonas corrugata]